MEFTTAKRHTLAPMGFTKRANKFKFIICVSVKRQSYGLFKFRPLLIRTINMRNYTFIVSCVSCASSSSSSSPSLCQFFFCRISKVHSENEWKKQRKKKSLTIETQLFNQRSCCPIKRSSRLVHEIPLSLVLYNTHKLRCVVQTIRWDTENNSKTFKDHKLLLLVFPTTGTGRRCAKQFKYMLICGVRVSSSAVLFAAFRN